MHPVLELDKNALIWINSHHNLILDVLLYPVALLGEVAAIWIVVCLAMLIIGKPGYRRTAIILMISMILVDRLIGAQLQHIFPRERPYLAIDGIRQFGIAWSSGSFPSGHAHSVWLAAIILSSQWKRLFWPLVVLAILTCYSRPYCGMHYPLDALVGSMVGISAGLIVVGARRFINRRRCAQLVDSLQKVKGE